jgi:hypothetical protein
MSVHGVRSTTPRYSEVSHTSSHATLVCTASDARAPRSSWRCRIDAIIVPTSRGASALDGAAHLATELDVPLVALCSGRTVGAEAAARLDRVPGHRALIADVPDDHRHTLLPTGTSALRFREASAERHNDLWLKRNLGILLARLHGWGKILFLDDDIGDTVNGVPVAIPAETVCRLAAQLDDHQVAGLACREYPDNSVFCHARRLSGLPQSTFVSGAALAVNCNDQPVPFFPDQYNEDWFFFSRLAAGRELAHVGEATQAPYDPYRDPERARQEEFGDLLAEGLYELFEKQPIEMKYFHRLEAADARYWERYIAVRSSSLGLTQRRLQVGLDSGHGDAGQLRAASQALDAAVAQLSTLTPEVCVAFLEAWTSDLRTWEPTTQRIRAVHDTPAAMGFLGLTQWYSTGRTSQGSVWPGTARRRADTSVLP